MSDEQRYGLHRGLFLSLGFLLIFAAMVRSCTPSTPTTAATTVFSANYERRFCDDSHVKDVTNENPLQFTIKLRPGCFEGPHKLPLAWDHFHTQHSKNPGEWFAIWCNGSDQPRSYKTSTQDFQDGDFNNCFSPGEMTTDFYAQGQGTITFRRTRERPEFAAQVQQKPAAEPDKAYRLTSIVPLSGDPDGYSLIVKQCYRAGEHIQCWGTITNKTDAAETVYLRDSQAVDDEGNSIMIAINGSEFMFVGANTPYGTSEHLLPGVPTKVSIHIDDPHLNVKTINLELIVNWPNPSRYDHLIYKDVPVQ